MAGVLLLCRYAISQRRFKEQALVPVEEYDESNVAGVTQAAQRCGGYALFFGVLMILCSVGGAYDCAIMSKEE